MKHNPAKLWIAVLILASASSVVRKLVQIGAENPIDGRNPISFCNVLFAGNLVAFLLLVFVYRREWTRENLKAITATQWLGLTTVAVLAVALAPSLIFIALERTTVTSVVLLGRIEPPLVLALGALVLGDRLNRWGVIGAVVALVGVAASLLLQPMTDSLMFGRGEAFALAGAVCLALATILAKARLGAIPPGIFAGFRMAVGTVVFFCVVVWLYGAEHFIDIFAPQLWKWMLVYGAIVVTGGQLLWFSGLRGSDTLQVVLASSISPVVGIAAAYLILGEIPMRAQFIGGGVILLGIAIGVYGAIQSSRQATKRSESSPSADYDRGVGFKGV